MRENLRQLTEKIPGKMQKILLYAGGLLLVLFVYVFVFQSLNLKCQEKQIELSKGQKDAAAYTAMKDKQKENERFERFSFKQLIKGTIYFRGRIIDTIEDVGFNNVEEIINI